LKRRKTTAGKMKRRKVTPERPFKLHRYWVFTALAVVLLFSAAIRLRLLQFPLERDEGEYAYAGQLMLRGIPPYLEAYNMKLPGTYAAYALLMAVFGQTIGGVHLGLILVNSISIVLVFVLARRLFDPLAGVAASAAFAILSVSPAVLGLAAHATHFVALFSLGGAILLLKANENKRPLTLFLSGLLFGLAFTMKQPGIFFGLFGGLYLLWTELRARPIRWRQSIVRVALFALGTIVPFGLTCLILWRAGVFSRFWFWTFSYASQYVSETSAKTAWNNFWSTMRYMTAASIWLWVLAGIGLVLLWRNRLRRVQAIFLTGLLIFALFAVCPGFYFRQHYFIVVLPVIGILGGVAVSSVGELLHNRRFSSAVQLALPLALIIAAIGYAVFRQAHYFFEMSPAAACNATYHGNPFAEAIAIGNYVKNNSQPSDRIAVMGSEPEIYFYASRRGSTGYIYTYPLMENQAYAGAMQQEMIRQIESAPPTYLLYIDVSLSWLRKPGAPMNVFEWLQRYKQERYDLVGMVDMLSPETVYRWGSEARNYSPSSKHIEIYKLRNHP
jgi:hypothetical protein